MTEGKRPSFVGRPFDGKGEGGSGGGIVLVACCALQNKNKKVTGGEREGEEAGEKEREREKVPNSIWLPKQTGCVGSKFIGSCSHTEATSKGSLHDRKRVAQGRGGVEG
jgi:hypothetical protein